ncbi:sex peptide receptor-like [Mercenaria mercenaria]|uniref:sex peptide receptor-like n=1 Tax=Mercenaria mercenaria TaxID=6596 RepID=UPI00234F80DF|nr:sex peptide receptor-like [Mercenaria mercenaria]
MEHNRNNSTQDSEMYGDEGYDIQVLERPFHLEDWFSLKYTVPLYSYIAPVLVLLTVVSNTLVLTVLLKKHIRSPTNVILAGIAFSDMLTGVIPLPVYIYFFSMGHYKHLVPFGWCVPLRMLYAIIPTIFHTASIWLTVVLAAQRYICICYSQQGRTWCTIANMIRATVIVYIVAFLSQLTKFVDFYMVPIPIQNYTNPDGNFEGCSFHVRTWVLNNYVVYQNTYFWFRIICIHLVPCTALVILNGLLIAAMQKAKRIRIKLLKPERESQKLMERNSSTLMLVAVIGIFLLVEFSLVTTRLKIARCTEMKGMIYRY